MLALSDYLIQLNELFDELLVVATTMRDRGLCVLAEKEFVKAQIKEKEILSKIADINQILEAQFHNQVDKKEREKLQNKIKTFENLNKEYIDNLQKSHGLIQFNLVHLSTID